MHDLTQAVVRPPFRRELALALAVLLCTAIVASSLQQWRAVLVCMTFGCALSLGVARPHALLGIWIATSPWLNYLVRFPDERSLVTYDRILVLSVVVGFLVEGYRRRGHLVRVSLFEVSWALLSVCAMASVVMLSLDKGIALRTVVDAFILPVMLFYAIRSGFDPREGRWMILGGACLLAVSLPWLGVGEFLTGIDLYPFEGSSIFRTGIVRANGPYATDNSYAIISAIVALFVYWYPRDDAVRLSGVWRLVRLGAIACAAVASIISLFRTIVGAVVIAGLLPYLRDLKVRSLARIALLTILGAVALSPIIVSLSSTDTFQNRFVDTSSAYSRAATYLAAADIIEDRPLFGVGLLNYHDYFVGKYGSAWYVEVEVVGDVSAEGYPHNNALAIWAELGIVGLFLYLAAWFGLLGEAVRTRRLSLISLLLIYWIPGLTLQSGYYGDLNQLFFSLYAVLVATSTPSDPLT